MMSNFPQLPVSLNEVELPKPLPPLMLIAFNRPELLKQVLIGISQQSLLPQQIIAFIDGIREAKDQPLVDKCIALLRDFSDQVPVEIVIREKNLGCDQNIITGFTEVLSSHASVVYLEDDTVPNKNFYERMCRLLTAYHDYSQVFSLSGYASIPTEFIDESEAEFMVSNRVFCWGFGIWADRWQEIDLLHQAKQYNPFGDFYRIPATVETKRTMINQFWLEKNNQTDWVISLTLAALHKNKVNIIPKISLVKNIGFGHPAAKTYNKGQEPNWVNAKYEAMACPERLPISLELSTNLSKKLTGKELSNYLTKYKGLWLSSPALLYFLTKFPDLNDQIAFTKLFLARLPILARRLSQGLPI